MPLENLKCLESHEIELLYCGSNNEKWEIKDLTDNIIASHGYTNKRLNINIHKYMDYRVDKMK